LRPDLGRDAKKDRQKHAAQEAALGGEPDRSPHGMIRHGATVDAAQRAHPSDQARQSMVTPRALPPLLASAPLRD
jgi:hypothetical protein